MNAAYVWLEQNSDLRNEMIQAFNTDPRLAAEANISDAVASSPTLLPDIMKSLVCEAIKRDAAHDVVDELLAATRKMKAGVKQLSKSERSLAVLKGLRGSRTNEEIDTLLRTAAAEAETDFLRKAFDRARSAIQQWRVPDSAVTTYKTSVKECLACCGLGGLLFGTIGCVAGCTACGYITEAQ